jgi:hypothetical protein
VVSPWGNEELCYRDFEAILDGCRLVKPRSDVISALGNVSQEIVTYLACSPDGGDPSSVVGHALRNRDFSCDATRRFRKDLIMK